MFNNIAVDTIKTKKKHYFLRTVAYGMKKSFLQLRQLKKRNGLRDSYQTFFFNFPFP